ncbi:MULTISPECIES: YbjN domain-containing protein [unclassified Meiothermus]|uniref:YbjN domain-containing protein n=1 Tax=unclassified Meiothermus TaxID=370471 RepID=UPI001314579E|nr:MULTISPECIES: YbjN domain-containing protein [unclassified Meiothermus]
MHEVLVGIPGIRPLFSPEGHACVIFKNLDDDFFFTVTMTLDGLFDDVLVFMASLENPPHLSEETALRLANRWNVERRWPRVWVRKGKIWADYHLPLPTEVEPEVLHVLFVHLFQSLVQFSEWLAENSEPSSPIVMA